MSRDGTDSDYLSEAEAHALWRRAAQLQAESADRRESRARRLAAGQEAVGLEAIHAADVETAGIEAGIGRDYLRLARAETIANGTRPMPAPLERAADRLLGSQRRLIEISRVIDATPRQVLDAMALVFPANPYYLNLIETVGEPAAGGVMIFDITRRGEGTTTFSWDMMFSDIKQVLIRLEPAEDRPGATDVLLMASLNHSRRINLGVAGAATTAAGAAGSAAGTAVGIGLLGLGALAALPAVAGAIGGAALLSFGYRPVYRYGIRRGQNALEGMLRAVDLRLRTGGLMPPAHDPHPTS
jgi:hypothetical protein